MGIILSSLLQAIGGVGVFLLGMVVMTEGLKSLAGARVSKWLAEATRSPATGAVTGGDQYCYPAVFERDHGGGSRVCWCRSAHIFSIVGNYFRR